MKRNHEATCSTCDWWVRHKSDGLNEKFARCEALPIPHRASSYILKIITAGDAVACSFHPQAYTEF